MRRVVSAPLWYLVAVAAVALLGAALIVGIAALRSDVPQPPVAVPQAADELRSCPLAPFCPARGLWIAPAGTPRM
jgi:hypothetical protein